MTTRIILIALTSAAVIAGAAGCGKSSGPTSTPTPTSSGTASAQSPATTPPPGAAPSTAAAPSTTAAQSAAGATRDPCELLNPTIAKQFAGDDAERQLMVDSNPPLPVGDTACFYQGSSRSVFFSIDPVPTDPSAPVNHFHVIAPQNAIPGHGYTAYWFGPGQSVYVVKNGLLLNFQVQDNPGSPRPRSVDELKADDIKLADQIVPRVS
jgi:hypothetical protein